MAQVRMFVREEGRGPCRRLEELVSLHSLPRVGDHIGYAERVLLRVIAVIHRRGRPYEADLLTERDPDNVPDLD